MSTRALTAGASVWVVLFLAGYVWFVRAQGGEPAGPYVILLLLSAASGVGAVRARRPLVLSVTALATSGLALLAGLLSVGLLLSPAVAALAVAVALTLGRPPLAAGPARPGSPAPSAGGVAPRAEPRRADGGRDLPAGHFTPLESRSGLPEGCAAGPGAATRPSGV